MTQDHSSPDIVGRLRERARVAREENTGTALGDALHFEEAAAEIERLLGIAQPPAEWRCFHCDEVFTDAAAAKDHFGYDLLAEPGCKLNAIESGLLGIVRRQEDRLDAYHREDTASYREFYSLGSDHSQALRREEEKGYARGLADGQALAVPSTNSPRCGRHGGNCVCQQAGECINT